MGPYKKFLMIKRFGNFDCKIRRRHIFYIKMFSCSNSIQREKIMSIKIIKKGELVNIFNWPIKYKTANKI